MTAMRVLVTRPTLQASATLGLLREHGFGAHHLPCLQIVPLDPQSVDGLQNKQWAMDLDSFDHVVVISANAVQHWLDLIENYWPQWPLGLRWWAMGKASQALLTGAGIEASRSHFGDTSEALLATLLPHIKSHDKVLIVRGCGGRETLSERLTAAGAKVDYAQCYQRRRPSPTPAQLLRVNQFAPQAVILQSGETLANFDLLLGSQDWCQKQDTILVLPSARVAQEARDLGYQSLLTSVSASSQAMCDTLLQTIKK